jgi:hypothetical protein
MVTRDEFQKALRRGEERRRQGPVAVGARYDARSARVVIALDSGVELAFSPEVAEGLGGAAARDLRDIVIAPSGLGLHFPRLDADLYLPTLLEGLTGSRRWMAARLGRAGGVVRSIAKATASRENGRLGGRPPTNPPPGGNHRKGAMRDRSQTHNPKTDRWVKRDRDTGQFIDQKADRKPFKRVTKEK